MTTSKICILTPEYKKKIGGIGSCVDLQVSLFGIEKCAILSLDTRHSQIKKFFAIVYGLVKYREFFVHGVYFLIIVLLVSDFFPKKSFSLFFHGSELVFIKKKSRFIYSLFLLLLSKKGNNLKIFFVSEYLKKFYQEISSGNALLNSKVIYFGPEYQGPSRLRETKTRVCLLTVSRVVRQKGLFDMLHAFAEMDDREKFFWKIVGEGPDLDDLRELVISLKLENVVCEGKKTKKELIKYYQWADIFWLCSLYHEGLGLVYLEAASFGLPSVALDRGGVSEAIFQQKTGFLEKDVEASIQRIREYRRWNLNQEDFKELCSKRRNFEQLI